MDNIKLKEKREVQEEMTMLDKEYKERKELAKLMFEEKGYYLANDVVKQAIEIAPVYDDYYFPIFKMVDNIEDIIQHLEDYDNLDFFVEFYKDHNDCFTFLEMVPYHEDSIVVYGNTEEELGYNFFKEYGLSHLSHKDMEETLNQIELYIDFKDYWHDIELDSTVYRVNGKAYII